MKRKSSRNTGLKLVSLIWAFFIWLIVANVDDPVKVSLFKDVPIQMDNEESVTELDKVYDVIEDEVYSDSVVVKVKERRSILKTLSASDFHVIADMEAINELGAIPLRVECSNPAISQDELEIVPAVMKVKLEQKKQSEFMVTVNALGTPEKGYEVGMTEVVGGKTLLIAGPESLLKKIGKVEANVNVNRIKTDRRVPAKLTIYDKNGESMANQMKRLQIKDSTGVLLSENEVMVDITLWEVMSDIPVKVETKGSPAEGYQMNGISTVPVTVNLVGTKEALARLNGIIKIKDPIDVSGAEQNVTQEIDLTETLAQYESLRLVKDADPTISVTVQIEKTDNQTITIPLSNLEVLNRPEKDKLSLTISPADEITVVVHVENDGPKLMSSEIKATVDMSVCTGEGVYEIPVQITLPEGYTLVSEVKLVVTATALQQAEETEVTEE